MGSFSTCRALVHWQGLLLAVSLFICWSLPTRAQLAVMSATVADGSHVFLRIRNRPPNISGYLWYRGDSPDENNIISYVSSNFRVNLKGPKYTGREIIKYDGSLLILRANIRDAGMYTVVVYLRNGKREIGFGQLVVYEPVVIATLEASNSTVTENEDAVVLICRTNALSIKWLFNGGNLQLTERMELSEDQRSLTIDPVKREDAGAYQCEGSNPVRSVKSWPVDLHVQFD